jgi:CheY-like chemotaxis protein
MDGTLLVTDTSAAGTTFTLTLQRATARTDSEGIETIEPQTQEARQLTVVYIEDNMSNFKLVERIFARGMPVRLLTAIQGSLGLELIRRHLPDLILLDLHLPDMTGDQVLAQLKSDSQTADIPVVVISADATSGQIARLRAAGAEAYLTKPLDIHEFLATVKSATNKADET